MFITIIIITFFAITRPIRAVDDGRGADARSTDVHVGCFSGDSLVMLKNGEQKQIGYLKTGDEILTINHQNIIPSEMIMMLDKETSKQATFYTFNTASGHEISLTGYHLIPIISSDKQIKYIPAKEVQLNDQFYVLINNQLEYSPVINITIESKIGYYAPLTMTGTLLVNDIFASCYATAKNHDLAQIFMAPFRWYYKIARLISVTEPFDNNNRTDGIHWLIKLIYQFITSNLPSTLQ